MRNTVNVPLSFEKRISNKSGNEYECLVLKLSDTYEKLIFLKPAEIELLRIKYPMLFK